MGKTKTRYNEGFKNEFHRMSHSKPKRIRRPVVDAQDVIDNQEKLLFEMNLNLAHIIAIILACFTTPAGAGFSVGIILCILLSAIKIEIEEEED